jgi:hypothetical protein
VGVTENKAFAVRLLVSRTVVTRARAAGCDERGAEVALGGCADREVLTRR